MVSTAIKTKKLLEEKGIYASVYDMFSVKPIDTIAVKAAKHYRLAVTIEEHNTLGRQGAAVAEVMTEEQSMPRLLRCGIHDSFDLACDYDGLLEQNRLTPTQIAEDILLSL